LPSRPPSSSATLTTSTRSARGTAERQLQYLKQLAQEAGHTLDLTRISGPDWIAGSVSSHAADYRAMAAIIAGALKSP
jgi:cell filamentation protein